MYNKVILIGRLTATPEMVKTPNDKSVTRVTINVSKNLDFFIKFSIGF